MQIEGNGLNWCALHVHRSTCKASSTAQRRSVTSPHQRRCTVCSSRYPIALLVPDTSPLCAPCRVLQTVSELQSRASSLQGMVKDRDTLLEQRTRELKDEQAKLAQVPHIYTSLSTLPCACNPSTCPLNPFPFSPSVKIPLRLLGSLLTHPCPCFRRPRASTRS